MRVDTTAGHLDIDEPDGSTPIPIETSERGGIITRSSLWRGRSLSPGIQTSPFYWRDLVHGPPPRHREKGDSLTVVWHGVDDSGDVRLSFTTIFRVDPGMDKGSTHDDIVHVEERLYVQRRLLQEFIDREHAFTEKACLRMRSKLAQSMVQQRRLANRMSWAWAATAMLVLIRSEAKAGSFGIRVFRGLMRSLVALPDALLTHTERMSIHLASQTGRRTLKRALYDPMRATPQEKAGLLVLLALGTTALIFIAGAAFSTVLIAWDRAFQTFVSDFVLTLAGTVALPFPVELTYVNRAAQLTASFSFFGYGLATIGLLAGKMLGCWMLYLLGDSLFDTLRRKSGARMKRAIVWLQKNADKWGFMFLLLLNLVPLAPDGLIIVFAVSGMRFRDYMTSIAVGSVLKLTLLAGLIMWVGAPTVNGFLSDPLHAFGWT